MEAGQDAIRDEINNSGEESQPTVKPETLAWKKTFDRNTTFFYTDGESELEKSIKSKAEAGRKRGVDPLPENLNGNRFPINLVKPTVDSLGDWQLNLPPVFGPYPNIDSKSGYTEKPVYPEEIAKQNFNRNNLRTESSPVIERIKTRKLDYNKFNDFAGKQFTHLLDYFSAQNGIGSLKDIPTGEYRDGVTTQPNTKDIYLGSFIKTFDDNEDPTYLGYDIKIKQLDSPLFNGIAEDFIQQFADFGNSEIRARFELIKKFKEQFYKFLKTDVDSVTPKFNGGDGVKTYYLRKLTGINKLVEAYDGDAGKQFVDYTKDFITLTFNEDVTQNIGYLSTLYKALAYSRLNGKLILPENVLRFDAEIEITEVRKFNRLIKDAQNNIEIIADKISKYTYTLYECQFFFPSLPHGDSLDMSQIAEASEFEIKFNYKWSSLKFSKYTYDTGVGASASFKEYSINNAYRNPTDVKPNETSNAEIDDNGNLKTNQNTEEPKSTKTVTADGETKPAPSPQEGTALDEVKKAEETKNTEAPAPTELITNTTDTPVEPNNAGGGTNEPLMKKISNSAIQGASNESLTTQLSAPSAEVQKRLEEVAQATTFPEIKGFAQGILGGEIGKVAGELTSGIDSAKSFVTSRLGEVASTIINPINKGFNLNILGGEIGGALGSLSGNIGKGFGDFKSRLLEVASGTIAPNIQGFAKGILGGELIKTSGLIESLGKPGDLVKRLGEVASLAIEPVSKGFNLNILGGKISSALGSIGGNLGKGVEGLKSRLAEVTSATIAPSIQGFAKGILGGELIKTSGVVEAFKKPNELLQRLGQVAETTIAPLTKGFNVGMIGGLLNGSSGLTKNLVNPDITKRLTEFTQSIIEPKNKGFNLNILGGQISNLAGSIDKGGSDVVAQTLAKAKETLIDSGIKTISNGLTSQASLLNKTLANISNQKGPLPNLIQRQLGDRALEGAKNFVGKSLKSFFTK